VSGPILLEAVLFDLDGTLADTAPDLIDAANRTLVELGREPAPAERLRPMVSQGGAAILRAAMPDWDPVDTAPLKRFLDLYRERICDGTRLYDDVPELLDRIEGAGKGWGIVTNKPGWLTTPLLEALGLAGRAGSVVSGDTLATRKPDPAPVLHACRELSARARHAALVGDDARDLDAAVNAGALPVLVDWGYGSAQARASHPAVSRAARPLDLLPLLGIAP
jgi:2-phosphoglycolate phosphatase